VPVTQMISLDVQLEVSRLTQLRRVVDNNLMQYIVEAKRRGEMTGAMEGARIIALSRIDSWIQEELAR
jgi:hypothetical protein